MKYSGSAADHLNGEWAIQFDRCNTFRGAAVESVAFCSAVQCAQCTVCSVPSVQCAQCTVCSVPRVPSVQCAQCTVCSVPRVPSVLADLIIGEGAVSVAAPTNLLSRLPGVKRAKLFLFVFAPF